MRGGGNRIRLKKKEGLKTNFERSFYMVIDSSIGARLSWPTLFQTIAELGGRWRGGRTAVFCYKHKLKERWMIEEGEERLRRLQASDTKLVR